MVDSSENMENVKNENISCCICLSEVDEVSQATMEQCCHIFHIDCILKWGRKVNKCPLCKLEFHNILFQGKIVEVQRENSDDESTDQFESDDEMEFDSDDDDESVIYCEVCEEECTMEGERYTNCHGNCGKSVHMSCRGLTSEDHWYCHDCQPRRRRVRPPRAEIPERLESVSSSLRWAEDSISRQLRLMRQRMEPSPYEPPLIVPQSNESAIRLRSKSKLATEIGKEIMNDCSKPTHANNDHEVAYKRIRRNNPPSSSTLASHPIPASAQQTLLLTSKLSQNAQNSRKLDSNPINDLLTKLTAPSSGSSMVQRSPSFPLATDIPSYTATTSRAPTMMLKQPAYSPLRPLDHPFLLTQSSNSSTLTTTRNLVEQYINQLQAPLRISNLEQRGEMLSNLVPKVLSLCVLHSNQEFLSELLDCGILSVLAQYLTSATPPSASSNLPKLNSSSHQSDLQESHLSRAMKKMILRTIHCLPIKARHLFHLKTLQPNPTDTKIKIGKFIPLIRILADYIDREEQGEGDGLRHLSIRILNDWKTVLQHYPSAIVKVENILGKVN